MNLIKKPIFLSLLSALLLSLPWLGGGAFWVLVGFVPLFVLQKLFHDSARKGFLWWVALTITLWIGVTCYWVAYAFWAAAVIIPLVGVVSLWPAWWIYHVAWRRSKRAVAYTILICWWIALEWWYTMGDVSFPWLSLGGAWGEWPWAVQWYSMTGVFGGSLWILVANVAVYTAIQKRRVWGFAAAWVVLPIALSLAMYWSYEQPEKTMQVAVVQPNIDPYTEKYNGNGLDIILPLAAQAPASTRLFVAPETALPGYIDLQNIANDASVVAIQSFLRAHAPDADFIVGASTFDEINHYNSSFCIDTLSVEVYHKSKLVIGVEVVPDWVAWAATSLDFGGYVGSCGRQERRTVFGGPEVGSAICYESIYGEYFAAWVAGGAQLMTIITNDGWWGDTPGYRHHASYARLRAVENRRSVARSANTGISELIDPRGDIVEQLGWQKQGLIVAALPLGQSLTPYTAWGDMAARLALYVGILALLYLLGQHYRKRG